jgi:hypothetical protein
MTWVLKILQQISRFRRRIFGIGSPHWFNDGISLISYINILDLVPTLLAITLAPWHFYTRLPQYVVTKNTWFKTPLKFFTSGVTLIAAMLLLVATDVLTSIGVSDKATLARYIAFICLATPIIMPMVCLAIRILLAVASTFSRAPNPFRYTLLIPLDPMTYVRLRGVTFFWSIFYFGIYFFVAAQLLQLFGFYEFKFFDFLDSKVNADQCIAELARLDPSGVISPSQRQSYLDSCHAVANLHKPAISPEEFMFLGFIGIFACVGYLMLVNPYIWLLRASMIIPTKRIHKSDCTDVAEIIVRLSSSVSKKKLKRIAADIRNLERSVATLAKRVVDEDRRAMRQKPKYFAILQRERAGIFRQMLQIDKLRELSTSEGLSIEVHAKLVSLLDRLEMLSTAMKQGQSPMLLAPA